MKKPKAVRYAWATSPLGNLKVGGRPWLPLHSFRTDNWDYPEVEDPAILAETGGKKASLDAMALCRERRIKEGEMIIEVLQKLEALQAAIEEAAK